MPFDPDELANGLLRFMQDGRETPAGPPPAEMPGSGLNIEELQEQIKALQDQLKALQGDGGAQFIPPGPGRDAPELTPEERRKRDWEMFDKWRQGGDGEPHYLLPGRPRERPYEYDFEHPDPLGDVAPREKPNWKNLPYIREEDGPQEMPNYRALFPVETIDGEPKQFENLPYRYKEPMNKPSYELLNGTGVLLNGSSSPVEGLNLKVGRHGNNYTPSKVTPGKGASLN